MKNPRKKNPHLCFVLTTKECYKLFMFLVLFPISVFPTYIQSILINASGRTLNMRKAVCYQHILLSEKVQTHQKSSKIIHLNLFLV